MAQQMLVNTGQFDGAVLASTNLFMDIISELASGLRIYRVDLFGKHRRTLQCSRLHTEVLPRLQGKSYSDGVIWSMDA